MSLHELCPYMKYELVCLRTHHNLVCHFVVKLWLTGIWNGIKIMHTVTEWSVSFYFHSTRTMGAENCILELSPCFRGFLTQHEIFSTTLNSSLKAPAVS